MNISIICWKCMAKFRRKKQHGKGKHMSETRNERQPYAYNGIDKSAHMHMVCDVNRETASYPPLHSHQRCCSYHGTCAIPSTCTCDGKAHAALQDGKKIFCTPVASQPNPLKSFEKLSTDQKTKQNFHFNWILNFNVKKASKCSKSWEKLVKHKEPKGNLFGNVHIFPFHVLSICRGTQRLC